LATPYAGTERVSSERSLGTLQAACFSSSMAEQWTLNPLVLGSNPRGSTNYARGHAVETIGSAVKPLMQSTRSIRQVRSKSLAIATIWISSVPA
jgi:hypothetical protein